MPRENRKKTKSAPKAYALLSVAIVAAIVFSVWYSHSHTGSAHKVAFDNVSVNVERADTFRERQRGLSGRPSLPEGTGMLFIYEEPGTYGFHMKDMNFSIDIVWMDETGEVVDVTHSLSPDSYPETVTSREPAQYVLEVPAGFSREHGISTGDTASVQYE